MKSSRASVLNIASGILLGIIIAGSFAFVNERINQPIKAPQLPSAITFAGEKVPLEKEDIKEKLDREVMINYYNHGNILFLIKTANRYFPIITERLKANGVPDDFKYLCIAESNLVPSALSKAGAVSFWQFMNYTAPGYGLEINSQIGR